MIVRISGEDQYELEDSDRARLDELDNEVQEAIEAGDEESFKARLQTLMDFIHERGHTLPEDVLEGSDLILPPPDLSLAEAREDFASEGLLPD
jgi:PspA-Associated protein